MTPRAEKDRLLPLERVDLAADDPWHDVYSVMLGLLPDVPDPGLLEGGFLRPELRFEDFFQFVSTDVVGSLEDLARRFTKPTGMSPRMSSMLGLAYGSSGSTAIRNRHGVVPIPWFFRTDAGPNIAVVCSDGDFEDLALVWNLRSAHGDSRPFPLGIPRSLASKELLSELSVHAGLSHQGMAHTRLYLTSVSVPVSELQELVADLPEREVIAVGYESLLSFGVAAGRSHEDVIVFRRGHATVVAVRDSTPWTDAVGFSDTTRTHFRVSLPDGRLPAPPDVRFSAVNGEFHSGAHTVEGGLRRWSAYSLQWPTPILAARSVAAARGLDLSESEPGVAARTALQALDSIWELDLLAHRPLIMLLDEMGRPRGGGPAADGLPLKGFGDFLRVLGNNAQAAQRWLYWAELRGILVKGFLLQCSRCRLRQWLPVASFAPPVVCRGCGLPMPAPFRSDASVKFQYRLAERWRRVVSCDAMGHLLTLRFFVALMGGAHGIILGAHPGLNVTRTTGKDRIGEADVLLLTADGQFVPVEVKSSIAGHTEESSRQLDRLAEELQAPWTAKVACCYLETDTSDYAALETVDAAGTRTSAALTYDRLLDPHPIWAMGSDPLSTSPLSKAAIEEREGTFVQRLARLDPEDDGDWLSFRMTYRGEPNNGPGGKQGGE